MNCKNCGSFITENDQFCKSCGAATNLTTAQNSVEVANSFVQQPIAQQPLQQENIQQPMYQQPVYQQPNMNNKKDNSKGILIIIGTIIAVGIIALLVIVLLNQNKNNNVNDNNMNNNSTNTNQPSNVNTTPTYNVNVGPLSLKVPTNLIYEAGDEAIAFMNEEQTWIATLVFLEGSFNLFTKEALQNSVANMGFPNAIVKEQVLNNVKYVSAELSANGTNVMLAYAKATQKYVAGLEIYTQDNSFDYSILETLAPVISSIKENSTSNSIAPATNIDVKKIGEMLQK